MNRTPMVVGIVLAVLIADQLLKVWIKTHFSYGEEMHIAGLEWARLHFVENKGMAFGIEWGGNIGKLLLSLFRIFAIGFIIYLIRDLIKGRAQRGLLICFSLILAGAIGNMIDSAFYGLLFSESHYGKIASFQPGAGYAPFLLGKVVDMFYFPMIDTILPEWIPGRGGTRFQFFRPVFNLADSAITVGVILLLIFYRSFFTKGARPQFSSATPAD